MALETRIPKEINDYREKIVFGLSARQLASLAAAAGVVCVTAFILWYLLGIPFAIVEYVLIAEALPFAAFGFIRHKDMPFEQVARIQWSFRFDAKRLLKKTSLDFLPSLYPLSLESGSRLRGEDRHEHTSEKPTRKERRERKRQRECLPQTSAPGKHRSRPARKDTRKEKGREATEERAG